MDFEEKTFYNIQNVYRRTKTPPKGVPYGMVWQITSVFMNHLCKHISNTTCEQAGRTVCRLLNNVLMLSMLIEIQTVLDYEFKLA